MEHQKVINMESLSAEELNQLGVQYIDQYPDKAYLCFLKGAEKGSPKAMHNLATCFWTAKGVGFDVHMAFYWNKKAAEQGSTGAMRTLAHFYTAGVGVVKNEKAARYWLQKAANSGDEKAADTLRNYEVLKDPLATRILKEVAKRKVLR